MSVAHLPLIAVLAWWLGLVPLAVVAATKAPRAFWWLAAAFAISWLADTTALVTHAPFWVSRVYVVSQSALVCAVFLNRQQALGVLVVLVFAGLAAIAFEPHGPEVMLHLVGWLLAAGIAEDDAPQPLKRALVCYFGWGALAWLCYYAIPGWETWLAYQATRALGISLFGYACFRPQPELRLT